MTQSFVWVGMQGQLCYIIEGFHPRGYQKLCIYYTDVGHSNCRTRGIINARIQVKKYPQQGLLQLFSRGIALIVLGNLNWTVSNNQCYVSVCVCVCVPYQRVGAIHRSRMSSVMRGRWERQGLHLLLVEVRLGHASLQLFAILLLGEKLDNS